MEVVDYVWGVVFGVNTAVADNSMGAVEQLSSSSGGGGGGGEARQNVSVAMVVMTWSTLGVCLLTVLVILGLRYGKTIHANVCACRE